MNSEKIIFESGSSIQVTGSDDSSLGSVSVPIGMRLDGLTDLQVNHLVSFNLAVNSKKALSQLRMLRKSAEVMILRPPVFTRIQSLKFIKARYGK